MAIHGGSLKKAESSSRALKEGGCRLLDPSNHSLGVRAIPAARRKPRLARPGTALASVGLLLLSGLAEVGPAAALRAAEPWRPAVSSDVIATSFPVWLFARNLLAGVSGVRLEPIFTPERPCCGETGLSEGQLARMLSADYILVAGVGTVHPVQQHLDALPRGAKIPHILRASHRLDATDQDSWLSIRPAGPAASTAEGRVPPSARRTDPHWWASPLEAARAVDAMAHAFLAMPAFGLPRNRLILEENRRRYSAALREIAHSMRAAIEGFQNNHVAVDHNAFAYLARDTGLAITDLSDLSGAQTTRFEWRALLSQLERQGVSAIFHDPFAPLDLLSALAAPPRLPVAALHPVSSGSITAPMNFYEIAMEQNLLALATVLQYAPIGRDGSDGSLAPAWDAPPSYDLGLAGQSPEAAPSIDGDPLPEVPAVPPSPEDESRTSRPHRLRTATPEPPPEPPSNQRSGFQLFGIPDTPLP